VTQKGPRLGWLLGGCGSLIWLAILAVVWFVQARLAAGVLAALVFVAGIAYLLLLAPWRFPQTPMRRLYLGFLVILLAGVAVAVWQYRQTVTAGQGMPLLARVTLGIPWITLGRSSWSDLHDQGG